MINLSSTLCRNFLHNGTVREYCPYYIKRVILDRAYELKSEAIQKGVYFETMAIGSGAKGREVTDLPRKLNGEMRIDQYRILQQASAFRKLCKDYGIILTKENTQVEIKKKLSEEVMLTGSLDICPAGIIHPDKGYLLSIIDLKLTKNLLNTFGEFAWRPFENKDDIQGQIYLYLVEDLDLRLNDHLNEIFEVVAKRGKEMSFFYWVFDFYEGRVKGVYKPLTNRIFEVEKSDLKRKELIESLRKVYKLVKYHNENGWDSVPKNCERCVVLDCEFFGK